MLKFTSYETLEIASIYRFIAEFRMKYFNLQFNLHPDHIVIQFSCTFRNDFSETYSTNMIQYQICKMNDLNPLNVFVNKFRDLSQRARTIYIKTITCTQEEINWNRKTRQAEKEAKRWSMYHFIVMKWASITTDANREIRIFVCHYHYASVHSTVAFVVVQCIWNDDLISQQNKCVQCPCPLAMAATVLNEHNEEERKKCANILGSRCVK